MALNRLISRATDKCLPIFQILKKSFEWTEECGKALAELKQYLALPSLLARTLKREDLLVYSAVSEVAISAVLVKEEGKMFYTNRILQDRKSVV